MSTSLSSQTIGTTGPQGSTGPRGATGPIGGLNTQIIYNNSGSASGDSTFTFNASSKLVTAQSLNLTSGLTGTTQVYGNLAMNNYQIQNPIFNSVKETIYNLGNVSSSCIVNASTGNSFYCTLNGNTNFSFTGFPATGTLMSLNMFISQPAVGNYTGAFANTTFGNQVSYSTFSTGANGVDVFNFVTYSGGSRVFGFKAGSF